MTASATEGIPFLDLRAAYREIRREINQAFGRVMKGGQFILGPELEQFEQEFAESCGAKYAVGVGNGLDALEIALRAANVGPGDEVIVPAHTFVATWLAVTAVGARPVPVDVDEFTYNISPEMVRRAVTPRTRAVIPVHLYGQPVEIDPLLEIAEERQLLLLEDAAQAHGARYRNRRVGSLGKVAAFSFYPGKNLGAFGDGGAIVTSSSAIARKCRLIRNYGSRRKYVHEVQGTNSRLDELQAAFLRVRLRHLSRWNRRRAAVAQEYITQLTEIEGLRVPAVAKNAQPVWHIFAIQTRHRKRLQAILTKAGIGTGIHYPRPPHQQPAFRAYRNQSFPATSRICSRVLSLPMGPHLSTNQVERVVATIRKADGR